MLRIIAGKFRSRLIKTPLIESTRPTKDRVREAIFSAIGPLHNKRVLDVFAGSGAFAFEALSRGAIHATCIDRHPKVFQVLKDNQSLLKLSEQDCTLLYGDFKKNLVDLVQMKNPFDVIFIDPPYGQGLDQEAIDLILAQGLLTEDGIIVLETDKFPQNSHASFVRVKDYDYGATRVRIHWRSL